VYQVKNIKKILRKINTGESGQILILVLVFMVVGSIILVPLLSFMATGARSGEVFETKTEELYAADAGIQDAVWQVSSGKVNKLTSPSHYSQYDYATEWDDPITTSVNDKSMEVTIQNIWIPKDISIPGDPETIIEGVWDESLGGNFIKLLITGSVNQSTPTQYEIKILYNSATGDGNFKISELGVWLPNGFTYVAGSSNLEGYTLASTSSYKSGQAVIWDFAGGVLFSSLPNYISGGGTGTTSSAKITFTFNPAQTGKTPIALSWMVPDTSVTGFYDLPVVWDADAKVYKLTSTSGDSTVESFVAKSETRKMQAAISGEYYATGNSLLEDSNGDDSREDWVNGISAATAYSSAGVTSGNIPQDAEVAGAFLYWSAWREDTSSTYLSPLNPDDAGSSSDITNIWTRSGSTSPNTTAWGNSSPVGNYQGHYAPNPSPGPTGYENLTLKNPLDLSSYAKDSVTVSWKQWVPTVTPTQVFYEDCTDFTSPPMNWNTSGASGNPTNIPTGDGDSSGIWTTTPLWSKVDETAPDDNDFITGSVGNGIQTSVPFSEGDSHGNWATAPLWSKVDEITANDTDYITGTTLSENQTMVPTADGDTSGTWNTAPCWDDVDETTFNDSDYMTGTVSGNQIRYPSGDFLPPSGTWDKTSNMYSYVDETAPDGDTSYLLHGTTAGNVLFSFSAFNIPAGSVVQNLTVYLVARDNTNGTNKMQPAIRVGSPTSTNYLTTSTSTEVPNAYGTIISYAYNTNPLRSAAWTVDDINGIGSYALKGFGVRSADASPQIRLTQVYAQVNYTTSSTGYKLFSFSPSFSVPSEASIANITVYFRAGEVTSGTNNIRASIKANGTRYNGTSIDPTTTLTTYNYLFTTNPDTGTAWTVEDINGTGPNPLQQFGVYSSDLAPDIQVTMVYAQVNYEYSYQLFNIASLSVPASASVTNVTVYVRARDATSGSNDIRPCINVNGIRYNATFGNDPPIPTSPYTTYNYVYNTNPATGLAWTAADVNGTGSNPLQQIGVFSNDLTPGIQVSMIYIQVNFEAGGYQLFTFSPFEIPAGGTVTNITVNIRARDATSGTNDIRPCIMVNGAKYYPISGNDPTTSFATYSYSFATNPDTGLSWTTDDINGTGLHPLQQFGVYSSNLVPDIRVSMVYAQVAYEGSRWSFSSGQFQGRGTSSAGTAQRTLTMNESIDLHSYAPGTVSISWDQSASLAVDSTDHFYYAFYNGSWSTNYEAFSGNSPSSLFNIVVPDDYLKSNFKMRFFFDFNSTDEYVYIYEIYIRYSNDGLDFAFYDGISWSDNYQAFRWNAGIPTSEPTPASNNNFSFVIPQEYLTDSFKIRFSLVGFDGTNENCNIDDITVTVSGMQPDASINFKINGTQVYYDSSGPQTGTHKLTASKSQVVRNYQYSYGGSDPHGYSYSCFRDVTTLVRTFTIPTADGNYPGYATYTVGDVFANTDDQWSYAGWSLIIIYTSAETYGHQLYLFDNFIYSNQDPEDGINVDFDNDDEPGGTITGFFVPNPVSGEVNAAKITCFVGEGDEIYSGDFLALNAPEELRNNPTDYTHYESYKLWDGTTSSAPGDEGHQPNNSSHPNNVWNSKSTGLSAEGVDVDTFNVTWASGLLNPGDTSARIELVTRRDVWNLVYMIVSFRSSITTGGSIAYLIK
jgi:hypothetical protein